MNGMDREYVDLNLSNYYGSVVAERMGEEFRLRMDDWDGFKAVNISKELFDAIKKEFGSPGAKEGPPPG